MCYRICDLRLTRISDGLNVLSCALQNVPSGVGRWGGFYSHKFIPAFWCVYNLSVGFFSLVLQGVVQYLGYLLSVASQSCPIWKVSLGPCSVLEGSIQLFIVFGVFGRDSEMVRGKLQALSTQLSLRIRSNIMYILPIFKGFPRPVGHYWLVAFLGLSWSRGSLLKRDPEFWEGLIRDGEWYPGKYSPCLLVLLCHGGEWLNGIFSLISNGIYFISIFSHVLWVGNNKIEVI